MKRFKISFKSGNILTTRVKSLEMLPDRTRAGHRTLLWEEADDSLPRLHFIDADSIETIVEEKDEQ